MHRCAELYSFEWRLNFGNRTQADRATHANVQVYSSYGLYSSYGKIGYQMVNAAAGCSVSNSTRNLRVWFIPKCVRRCRNACNIVNCICYVTNSYSRSAVEELLLQLHRSYIVANRGR